MTEWPTPASPDNIDEERKLFDAKVELAKSARQDELDLDQETSKKLYEQLLTLATGSVERSRKAAELVQGAAVAIAGLYTGILGFIFVAKDNPMPWRGVWATVFLAGAIVFAMSYVAFLTRSPAVAPLAPPANDNSQQRLLRRAFFLSQITSTMVHERAHLLRAAVVSLAVGVVLLPAAFLQFNLQGAHGLSWGAGTATASATAAAGLVVRPRHHRLLCMERCVYYTSV